MLQRAASNAYSWWWASHIRTKQSKWLDGNLQEMEERVKSMLKLLGEEADSFGKRAEMYYKKRPEVISSVEEAYRAYRALAERYDHISSELHKANHTIATAFPDQVQYAMLEQDDDDNFPKAITPVDSSKIHKQTVDGLIKKKRDRKLPVLKEKKGVSKENAQEEINKLQKEILVIQTEKEFIKSSYESGIAKYWDLEKKMADMQEEVIFLQEEFNTSAIFEDDEARALMAATALKSCEDTVFNLGEKQRKALELERVELERIRVSKERLRAIKREFGGDLSENDLSDLDLKVEGKEDGYEIKMERMEMHRICEKIKSQMDSDVSIEETAEIIDQLVNKVVDLELLVSSQTAQINRLNLENGNLEKYLENLESEKSDLINDSSELNEKFKQVEDELSIIQSIQKAVVIEENNVRLNFSQVVNNLTNISNNLQSPIVNEEIAPIKTNSEIEANGNIDLGQIDLLSELSTGINCSDNNSNGSVYFETNGDVSVSNGDTLVQNGNHLQNDISSWERFDSKNERMFEFDHLQNGNNHYVSTNSINGHMDQNGHVNGEDETEKNLLLEFKETKKRLSEIEAKNQEHINELSSQIRELMNINAMKDNEILSLKQLVDCSKTASNNPSQDSVSSSNENNNTNYKPKLINCHQRNHIRSFSILRDLNLEAPKETEAQSNDTESATSSLEEKFRTYLDALLEENLEFWLRFSMSIQTIQEFQNKYQQMQKDETALDPKDLRALKTEIQVWLEQNAILRSELKSRLASICSVKEEINRAVGPAFSSYQAAKFQGEVLNMQQENNRVSNELKAGLDHVRGLQTELETTLERIQERVSISERRSGAHNGDKLRAVPSKNRVPLRSFLFPSKPKKPSLFSCVNPVLHRQYSGLKSTFYTRID